LPPGGHGKAAGKQRLARFGEVIVPHTSNYAAMLNAAEYWGCDWLEIIDDVEVWAVGPDAVPVKMPRHERKGR
jgi:hypothetical protein